MPLTTSTTPLFKDALAEKILGEDATKRLTEYNAAVELRKRVQDLVCEKDRARQRYDQAVNELDQGIAELQKKCKHQVTDYQPDPSGNNDSTTECLICGKYL